MSILGSRKRRIRSALEALPLGVGSNLLVPLIKWMLATFVRGKPIIDFRKKRRARDEAGRIHSAIQGGARQVSIVYDNLVSSPTYGDYLFVVFLARYFIAHGIKVNFIIADSEYRQDWRVLAEVRISEFVSEKIIIS